MAQCTKITVWEMHELKRFTSRKHGGRTSRRIKEKEKKWSRQEKEKEIKRKIMKVEETSDNEKKKKTCVHERMFEWITVCVHTLFITESSCVRACECACRSARLG